MRHRIALLLIGFVLVAPALASAAPGDACVDPMWPYRAVWLSGRDILVTATLGKHRPRVRAATTCIGLDAAARISVSASTGCLTLGDGVAITRLGEPVQTCRISSVSPVGAETPDGP